MTTGVNIHEAKSTLSKLIEKVNMGEDVIISRAGKPVAKLIPFQKPRPERKFGSMKGQIRIADDFDETPDEIIDTFYNGKLFPPPPGRTTGEAGS